MCLSGWTESPRGHAGEDHPLAGDRACEHGVGGNLTPIIDPDIPEDTRPRRDADIVADDRGALWRAADRASVDGAPAADDGFVGYDDARGVQDAQARADLCGVSDVRP